MRTIGTGLIGRRALGAASACLLLLGAIPALAFPDNPSAEWQALIEAAKAEGGVTVLANANLGAGTLTGFLLSLCEADRTGKGGPDLGLGRR